MKLRKSWLVLLLGVCLAATAGFGTLAYVTVTDRAENVITTGSVEIALVQNGVLTAETQQVMPGDTLTDEMRVQNTGEHPVWVRVEIGISMSDGSELDPSVLSLDINTAYWTEKDGAYYYTQVLQPGAVSQPVFTTVSFDSVRMDNSYEKHNFQLDVNAAGVQSENNGTSVMNAIGWPEA